jgi:hypothetical protein
MRRDRSRSKRRGRQYFRAIPVAVKTAIYLATATTSAMFLPVALIHKKS